MPLYVPNGGEILEAELAVGSATALTTNTAKTVISKEFPAGTWDLYICASFLPVAGTSITQITWSIGTADNTLNGTLGALGQLNMAAVVPGTGVFAVSLGPFRALLATPTTYYLVERANFTVSTLGGYGKIWGVRV